LQLRRAQPQLFSHGDYRRLPVRGSRAHHLCAFARRCGRRAAIVIAPRLYRRLLDDPARLPLGSAVWENTVIELPASEGSGRPLRNVLDGTQLQPVSHGNGAGILAAQALARFPVALLTAGDDVAAADGER
jgi:(1->4)-alpha-D-glucan 1-alpha-D-glucosylmutase